MPPPPQTSVFTRYVLENPWPGALLLLAAGAILAWMGFRDGLAVRIRAGAVLGGLALLMLTLGRIVVTAGEHGREVTRAFVTAVLANDMLAIDSLLSPACTLAVGNPNNPGFDREYIMNRVGEVKRYSVENNSITMLDGYTERADAATVHLGCSTTVQEFPYPTPSSWVLRIERQSDGQWRIIRISCISIGNSSPQQF
jgi:hypothetical protein